MYETALYAADEPVLAETGGVCYDGWWNASLSWDTAVPDFTNCFMSTLFLAVACVCLLFFFFAAACYSKLRPRSDMDSKLVSQELLTDGLGPLAPGQQAPSVSVVNAMRSPWFYAKAGVSTALLIGCVGRLAYLYFGVAGRSADVLAFLGDGLEIIVIMAAVYKTFRDQRQLKHASSTLFTTFLLLSLCHSLRSYSLAVRCNSSSNSSFSNKIIDDSSSCSLLIWEAILLGLSVMLFSLNCFADTYGRMARDKKTSPLLTISVPSFLTFSWVFKLVYSGWRRPITYDDLWHLPSAFTSTNTEKAFEQCWSQERKRAARRNVTPSLARALYSMIARKFWFGIILQFCNVLLSFASPLVLKLLLRAVSEEHDNNLINPDAGRMPFWKGVLFSVLLFGASVGASLFENHFYRLTYSFAITFRSALTLATYRKLYRVSNDARRQWTIGELVNLLSVDSQRVLDFTTYMYSLALVPISVTLAIVLLWQELGPSTLAGVAVVVFFMPINSVTGALQHRVYSQQLHWKDKRMGYMAEILSGIKVLKLYAWERPFMQRVMRCRTQEVKRLRLQSLLEVVGAVAWELTPIIMAISCFAAHVLLTGGDLSRALTAEKMFVSMALFNLLTAPLGLLPMIIMLLVQCRIALKRYAKFLLSDEADAETVKRLPAPSPTTFSAEKPLEPAVIVQNGCFAWTKHKPDADKSDESDIILHNINLQLPVGSLTAVVGVVGAGKSSLCSAVLGLMDKRRPADAVGPNFVQVCGRIAYVPQQAWIRNDSLQHNIVFTSKFDAKKYERVIDACALRADFDILPGSDETEIGEKGVNLSGGQKQRVSLARAAYSDADVYILDDPLSAVDAHVAQHLFDQLISNRPGSFLRKTTRLLITHSTSVLPHCDMIVVLEDGRIVERGTYGELMQRAGGRLAELVSNLSQQSGGGAMMNQATSHSSVSPSNAAATTGYGRSVSTATSAPNDPTYGISPRVTRMSSRGMAATSFSEALEYAPDAELPKTPNSAVFAENSYAAAVDESDEKAAVLKPLLSIENGSVAKISESDRNLSRIVPKTKRDSLATSGDVEKNRVAKLIAQEEAQIGNVGASVYLLYARLMSIPLSSICFIAYFVYQAFFIAAEIWLVNWSSNIDRFIAQNSTVMLLNVDADQRPVDFLSWQKQQLVVFASLGGGMTLFLAAASFLLSICTVRAMYYLHKRMLERIMHAPMWFFDTTPLGRLINRFSRDIDSIDTELPARIRPLMQIIVSIVGILALICYGTPAFSVVVVVLLVLFIFVQRFYICTSRQLKRIETVNRSPIFSHFSETAQGIAVIKAMQLHDLFVGEFERHVDAANVPFFYWFYADRWVFVALSFIGALCVLFASLFAILSPYFGVALTPSILGLVVSNALNLSMPLQWFVRILSETETYIVSVERIKEYMENVPQEASWDTPTTLALTPATTTTTNFEQQQNDVVAVGQNSVLRSHWPEQGVVEFHDYATRYRAGLDLVLNGIEANVKSCEKIGIAGRTGAGKSSLTLALFRIVEAVRGKIVIDGVDISRLGLHDLRSRLTIIPQEPVLFSGTLRFNVDPEEIYSDAAVWKALEHSHLREWAESFGAASTTETGGGGGGLSMMVVEDGQNLSVGQRQLVCLARALLRKSRILVLDEATAAVDAETDELIQRTIRREFADATVITIAHRLNTILDCDRVMIVDAGKVKEFDRPAVLLRDKTSELNRLARAANIAAAVRDEQQHGAAVDGTTK